MPAYFVLSNIFRSLFFCVDSQCCARYGLRCGTWSLMDMYVVNSSCWGQVVCCTCVNLRGFVSRKGTFSFSEEENAAYEWSANFGKSQLLKLSQNLSRFYSNAGDLKPLWRGKPNVENEGSKMILRAFKEKILLLLLSKCTLFLCLCVCLGIIFCSSFTSYVTLFNTLLLSPEDYKRDYVSRLAMAHLVHACRFCSCSQ